MIEDKQPVSELAHEKIKLLREAQKLDRRMVMSPADAAIALGCKETRVRELMGRGEISSYLDGKLRRIFVASVYDYLARRIIESCPIEGGELKARAFLGKRPQDMKRKKSAAMTPATMPRRSILSLKPPKWSSCCLWFSHLS